MGFNFYIRLMLYTYIGIYTYFRKVVVAIRKLVGLFSLAGRSELKRLGPQDLPVPARTKAIFCTKNEFWAPPRRARKAPKKPPKSPKSHQKCLRPLKKGNPGAGTKGFPDLQKKGLYGP